jgi:hypothetical protein
MLVNAPNADVTLGGGGSAGYSIGAIQVNNISVQGGYPVYYDVQMNRAGGRSEQWSPQATLVRSFSRGPASNACSHRRDHQSRIICGAYGAVVSIQTFIFPCPRLPHTQYGIALIATGLPTADRMGR